MSSIKNCVILFFIWTILVPDIYPQTEEFSESLKNNIQRPENIKTASRKSLNIDLNKNSKSKENQYILGVPNSLIDSVISLSSVFGQRKFSYYYNTSGKITLKLTQKWIDGQWVNSERTSCTYDSNGKIILEINEQFTNNQWVNYSRYTKTYDSLGNLTSEGDEYWEDNQWVYYLKNTWIYDSNNRLIYESSHQRSWINFEFSELIENYSITYTYDFNGKLILEDWGSGRIRFIYTDNNITLKLKESWDNNQWKNSERTTYTYDNNGNITLVVKEYNINDQLINNERNTYVYDLMGNIISETYEYWEDNQWINSVRNTFTFDYNANLTLEKYEYWEDNQWVNSERNTFTYDYNGNLTLETNEYWENNLLVISKRNTYTYDYNGNLTFKLYEYWENDQWVNKYRISYIYNSNTNLTSILFEYWSESDQWVLGSPSNPIGTSIKFIDANGNEYSYSGVKINIYYRTITALDKDTITQLKFSLEQNYPNPFNPVTTIKYQIPLNEKSETLALSSAEVSNVRIVVYDVLGREVATLVDEKQKPGNYEVNWNGRDHPSGVYFYRLIVGDYNKTKKMLMIK